MRKVPLTGWARFASKGAAEGAAGCVLFGVIYFPAALGRIATDPHIAGYAAVYVAACLAWGVGYAYLAATQPQVNRFPVLSGLSFGVIVYVVTQLVLYGIAAEQIHTVQQVAFGLGATCLFFGLPVAVISVLFERMR